MNATKKQIAYIRALLVEQGLCHARYGSLSGASKHLPHGPSMRERGAGGGVEAWAGRLTVGQASEVIDYLRTRGGRP